MNELLDKIELDGTSRAYFINSVFMRPQVNYQNNSFSMKILNKDYIPATNVYNLQKSLEKYLGLKCRLQMQYENLTVNNQIINDILDNYNVINKKNTTLIPLIYEKSIYLSIEDKNEFADVASFMKDYGINYVFTNVKENVELDEKRTINFKVDENAYNSYSKATPYRKKSKFTSVDDYLFMKMNKLTCSDQKVFIQGKVFGIEVRSGKSKKTNKPFELSIVTISDFTDAIVLKRFSNGPDDFVFHEGQVLALYGTVKFDSFDNNNVFEADHIVELSEDPFVLKDEYDGLKHIDLHVHTNRSEMDGVSSTSELINQAFNFGAKAIAITDTSVVQAYPLAQQAHFALDKAHKDNDFKVIYGIDVKVADDTLNIVYNPNDDLLSKVDYAVLDLETTGLSTRYDHIIEFGGTIVENGHVTANKKQLFIKPPCKIPPFIENKTNITNEMVENALPFEQAIDEILEWIGDRVIVAHNADFDFNFLNDKLVEIGREPLKNVCLDTLNLARQVVKNRKRYNLGVIANYYKINYDEEVAHRGDYDAEVLANVLVAMFKDIENFDTLTFHQLQENQDKDNFKKAHVYNATLLAKNMKGIKSIYEIVTLSHTKYLTYFAKENSKKIDSEVSAEPRILKSEINKRRDNILVGSCDNNSELFEIACNRSLKDLEETMEFYDYIELQPLANYQNRMEIGSAFDIERLKLVLNDIINTADKLGKRIIASSDVYYTHPYQKIARDVYIMGKRIGGVRHPLYPYNKEKRKNFIAADQHLMPTNDLLELIGQYSDRAKEFVIDNPNAIADEIEKIYPIPTKLATPTIEGCEDILQEVVYQTAHEIYGDPLPEIVSNRITKELTNIIKNGFSVQYYIAYLLVKRSTADGYPVGSRGSVGSSFIATMANITEVNPLVPHYVCPNCKHSEFFENNEYADGFDLPVKNCPVCGQEMRRDGHNIPFETFLGFDGDKVPDIDLNFSAEYQNNAQQQIREIFGFDYSYRAGTIGTVAQKTAYGYVKGYCEEIERDYFSKSYSDVLSIMCMDVKRTTGQHPGGIVVIPKENEVHDFTPIQYPANNPFSNWLTTHFAFADLHDNILKLDILGHVDPTAIRLLSQFSGVDYRDVPMSDPATYSIFNSTEALGIQDYELYHETNGAAGLPEFGTHNNRRILNKTKPNSFAELVNFEGVTHGTDVWSNNAEVLIDKGIASFNEVISCRDDIMSYLIAKNMDKKMSFDIMEKVRKGKGLTAEWIDEMKSHDVPEWYINSCQLIKYMFPKAHAVAYAMNALRVAWYKVHKPAAYYAVYFSIRCDAYDIETMLKGKIAIYNALNELQGKIERKEKISNKEEALEPVFEISLEMYLRGYHFNPISLQKSQATKFIIDPDDDHGIIPAFTSIDGLGEAVANSIVEARNEREFSSKNDFSKRTSVNNTQMAFMERLGILDGLTEDDQLSFDDFFFNHSTETKKSSSKTNENENQISLF